MTTEELMRCPHQTLGCDGTGWDARCATCGGHICFTWAAFWNLERDEAYHCSCAPSRFRTDPADEQRRARKETERGGRG